MRAATLSLVWVAALAVSVAAFTSVAQPSEARAAVVCPNNGIGKLPPGKAHCRPVCETPAKTLTAAATGLGLGTFSATARNPYDPPAYDYKGNPECAVPASATTWNVKRFCAQNKEFHCLHWHTYLSASQGLPVAATVLVTATPNAGAFFTGWSSNCLPSQKPTISNRACSTFMDAAKTVTAKFDIAPDPTAPTTPTLSVQKVKTGTVKLTWTASTDETWLGGYELYRDGVLYAPHPRAGASVTSVTLGNQLCKTTYTWEVRAFDTEHVVGSNGVAIDMGNQCPKPPPPGTILHIRPSKVTHQRSAFFHWGPVWKAGVTPTRVNYGCRIGKQRTWKRCFPGKTYRRLKPGKHTFRVRAGNANGWDQTPVKFVWTIKK